MATSEESLAPPGHEVTKQPKDENSRHHSLCVSTGWTMLKQRDEDERNEVKKNCEEEDTFRDAFYPLTLPLTVGPGSISVAITLGANAKHPPGVSLPTVLAAIIGSLLIGVCIFLCYGFADRLARMPGKTAMGVIMRLSSFLLICKR